MLNLRQVDAKNDTQTAGGVSNFSAPQFRIADSIYGNFSEPLEHGTSLIGEDEGPGRFGSVSEDISRDENSAQRDNETSTGSVGSVVEVDQMDESMHRKFSGTCWLIKLPFSATHQLNRGIVAPVCNNAALEQAG